MKVDMDSEYARWIRIFDITDISKHNKGFVIYKVISLLYPEKCPEAVTKLTVWKRYNDFKKLYGEMKLLHGKYNISDRFPSLPHGTFFKKYDEQALSEKKQSALNFLKYLGNHYQLFTSTEFRKFFETSYTPSSQLNGNITSIRADLNLPGDPEFIRNSDEDDIISDTDSISTISSISPRTDHSDTSVISSVFGNSTTLKLSVEKLSNTTTTESLDNISIATIESLTLIDGQIYSSPPRSPDSDEVYAQYIIDASVHIKMAEELENAKKFEESFVAYKTAIDILLRYGEKEENYDRRRLVKYKTEKYLLRAEKLYNIYLAPEMKSLSTIFQESEEKSKEQRPAMSDLYKYNVVRIIDSGMLVVHSDSQRLFYVKVIHKTTQYLDDNLVLPENVPFMVRLHNYYNCDNALFLVLEYINGVKLLDYLKQIQINPQVNAPIDNLFDKVNNSEISDDDSEKSFSELVSDYKKRKNEESFEIIDKEDILPDDTKNIIDQPIPKSYSTHFENQATPRRKSTINSEDSVHVMNRKIVEWAAELIIAIEKLHILGITCVDLRSRNLLIDEKGQLRMTYMCNVKEMCDVFNNTIDLNLAPEVLGIGPVGQEADWWSFGAILYEILVGMNLNDVHPHYFSSSTILKVPKYVSPEARSLLRQLLVYEPKQRLGTGHHGIDNLKSHPFFKEVEWNALLDKCTH
ncbi:hypothetical protein HHI36_020922 [Cryptolaemus montrouzieri]|uniref:Ribosomal protein S6 kinase delta-1 n=1 Tax=Cryptolaemus montrouzieri TaxID=559131 RepID=A0ABD2NCA4_9CUCU